MKNIPEVNLGLVVGSTDWLPSDLTEQCRDVLAERYAELYPDDQMHVCRICVTDNEVSVKRALKDLGKAECNALCLYFGNYGPEHTSCLLADQFDGPVMFCGAGEDSEQNMSRGRKDTYTGLINACYGLGLRRQHVYLPPKPVGVVDECCRSIHEFYRIARAMLALKDLKIIKFGPRPSSYFAACAPEYPLQGLGVELDEYSEMELYNSFEKHTGDQRIESVVTAMREELGEEHSPLFSFAQYEITINDWIRTHKGNRKYVAMTSTCWPAFPVNFGFVPCYVNSRLTDAGIPVACEVDVYGALSEYIGQCVSGETVTILNYNNDIPADWYEKHVQGKTFNGKSYQKSDLFLGYHCGVTGCSKLKGGSLQPHFVNNQLIGPEKSQGTLHGQLRDGPVTLFRIQADAEGRLKAYTVEGQILPERLDTYGGQGVIAVPEMERFYRHILLEQHYPNHFVLVSGHCGSILRALLYQLGIEDIEYNHPKTIPYRGEDIFLSDSNWF